MHLKHLVTLTKLLKEEMEKQSFTEMYHYCTAYIPH
jgi:hypothetical protein